MKTFRLFFFISMVAILATSCGGPRYLLVATPDGQYRQVIQQPIQPRRVTVSAYVGQNNPGYYRPPVVYQQNMPIQRPVVYAQPYQQQRPVVYNQPYQQYYPQMYQGYYPQYGPQYQQGPYQQQYQSGQHRPVMSQQEYLEMRRRQGYNY